MTPQDHRPAAPADHCPPARGIRSNLKALSLLSWQSRRLSLRLSRRGHCLGHGGCVTGSTSSATDPSGCCPHPSADRWMQAWPPAPLRGRPRGHGTPPSESLTGAATPLCPLSPSCHPPDSCHPSHPLYNDASHQTIRVELHVSWRETGWCERTPQVHSKSACSDGSPRPSGPPLWVLASRFADLVGLFGPPLDWPLYYGRHYQPLAVFCPQKPLCCFLLSAVFCSCSRIWDPY